jgi:thiamine-phosphate pyrophosphorylase
MLMSSPFEDKNARIAAFANIDIYPVISSEFTNNRPVLSVLEAIAAGGAKIVQLREKNMSKLEVYKLALKYREITAAHNMLLIINDHVDIAMACGADGVHLGQDDLPISAARRISKDLIFGSSTHDPAEAAEAIATGADYINIGPVYPTNTKAVACGVVGIDMVKKVSSMIDIPFTVMGGIKEKNIPELLSIGATRIAMVTEITQAENICEKTKQLRACWDK